MIAIIATFQIRPGQEDAFEAAARALGGQVRANEPGNRLYTLARVKREAQTYRFMELYADKDALKLHGGTAYFQAAMAEMKPLLAAEPVIELLDVVD